MHFQSSLLNLNFTFIYLFMKIFLHNESQQTTFMFELNGRVEKNESNDGWKEAPVVPFVGNTAGNFETSHVEACLMGTCQGSFCFCRLFIFQQKYFYSNNVMTNLDRNHNNIMVVVLIYYAVM